MGIKLTVLLLLITGSILPMNAQSRKVPGVVVNYIPASTNTYIGSPAICILPDGGYIASNDYFGSGTTEDQQGLTSVFKSTDKGKSWKKISEIKGQFWSNLFVHQKVLYIMGTWKHSGNFILRRSLDGGVTWSEPSDGQNGLLLEGEYHTAPTPVVIHDGRIWRALENTKSLPTAPGIHFKAMVISAPVNADLLNAANWTTTNCLPSDITFLNGKLRGWLEGNAVVTPEGKMADILRVETTEEGRDLAAIVTISEDGLSASFDPANGFIDFVGGSKKFTIRYDETAKCYWTIANMIPKEFVHLPAAAVRNTLVLSSSADMRNWTVHKVLLHHPDIKKHGFHYVDWQFDGQDIIYLSRTAYDDKMGGANNFHNANYLTFHRIKDFRKLLKRE